MTVSLWWFILVPKYNMIIMLHAAGYMTFIRWSLLFLHLVPHSNVCQCLWPVPKGTSTLLVHRVQLMAPGLSTLGASQCQGLVGTNCPPAAPCTHEDGAHVDVLILWLCSRQGRLHTTSSVTPFCSKHPVLGCFSWWCLADHATFFNSCGSCPYC